MAVIKGFLLIRRALDLSVSYCSVPTGEVEHNPVRKWRLEKRNAFDPTVLHQREEYREDKFDLQAVLDPDEYHAVIAFLTQEGQYYLEFTAYGEVKHQYPVVITELPKCPDDLHEYTAKVKFGCEARYIGTPGYINFGIIIGGDEDETVIQPV